MSDCIVHETLPLPPHYDPATIDRVWPVPYQDLAARAGDWRRQYGIRPAAEDRVRILLLPVDVQNTFCTPGFELFVAGRSGSAAVDDTRRLCEFIYRNLGTITAITATLDSHTAMQVFHPVYWVNADGRHPAPYTVITAGDVERGSWRVNPAVAASIAGGDLPRLQRMAAHYVRQLEAGGRYALTIWPYHAMLGGIGHALVSALEAALFFHTLTRASQTEFEVKGDNPLTENYSVLRPEVVQGPFGEAIAQPNASLVETLLTYDAVIIAGQAKSHCVAWTIEDLLAEIREREPGLVKRLYVLEDCTSPVVVPGAIDYTEQADAAFLRFAAEGVRLVRSTDPLSSWPGMPPMRATD